MMDSEIWHLLCIVTPCVFCQVWWLVTIEFVKVTVHKDITFTAAWSKCCIIHVVVSLQIYSNFCINHHTQRNMHGVIVI